MKLIVSIILLSALALLMPNGNLALAQQNNRNQPNRPSNTGPRPAGALRNASMGEMPGSIDEDAGTITGNERFLRENREGGTFVGGSRADDTQFIGVVTADPNEVKSGIGENEQLVQETRAQSATGQKAESIERQTGMYSPRLVLSAAQFPVSSNPGVGMAASAEHRRIAIDGARQALRHRVVNPAARPQGRNRSIEVSWAGDAVLLQGTVASAHDREMAELLVRLEPGIWKIRNEIEIRPQQ